MDSSNRNNRYVYRKLIQSLAVLTIAWEFIVNWFKWILMIAWPIAMLMGLFFMINFHLEPMGLFGIGMLILGFSLASMFIFGKAEI